jgi:hypothetical protein
MEDYSILKVDGDTHWGDLILLDGEVALGPVVEVTKVGVRSFVITLNRYGVGEGSVIAYIRGLTTVFNMRDILPVWEVYTIPINKNWSYVQIKLVGNE